MAGDVRGLRIAYSPALGFDLDVAPEATAAVAAAADTLVEHGARVVRSDPDMGRDSGNLRDAYHRLFFTETAVMARDWDQNDIARLDTGLQPMIERYLPLPARDYLAADSARVALMQRMSDFHRDYDLLLCPTTPIPAFAADHEVPEE